MGFMIFPSRRLRDECFILHKPLPFRQSAAGLDYYRSRLSPRSFSLPLPPLCCSSPNSYARGGSYSQNILSRGCRGSLPDRDGLYRTRIFLYTSCHSDTESAH